MKRLLDFAGGRKLVNDDIDTLQSQIDSLFSIWKEAGPFVVSGCGFTLVSGTTYSVAAGKVMLNGRLLDFAGGNVDISATPGIAESSSLVDVREYEGLAISKAGARSYSAISVNYSTPPSGDTLKIVNNAATPYLRTFRQALESIVTRPDEIKIIGNGNIGFFASGVGFGPYLGWALADGQSGRDNLTGRVPRAVDASVGSLTGLGSGATVNAYGVIMVQYVGTSSMYIVTP